ncbi:putative acyl-CoA thioester hydrolase [Enterobacteriaceae bacterium YMB-R22]|uniref:putative acyl-CoA thioester hydrolase n=1 Tax=Tenebrionicola larvae TaxID=2815733 RepID=UPI002013088B|nr:putative acyl-CoA thioester hydrolase [Tenebrionicola larvae]MBV4412316.1 putative acyl-CoA thioester hydrolase [Tenebrionicola larvae]
MNTLSVSRLAITLLCSAALTACSTSSPHSASDQLAPGTDARPVLYPREVENYSIQHWFSSLNPNEQPWRPAAIVLPQQPDFVVGPVNAQGVTHHTIQAAVDAAIIKHASQRQYIAILPGDYPGTVFIPAASGSITLYGVGEKPADVKIGLALEAGMDATAWRHTVNPSGKYMPGKPAWYMFDSCQNRRSASVGILCSAAVWSQNDGLQLQNLTIQNTLGDGAGAGDHPAVALRSDGDRVQINNVNLLGRQNTFFVTNSDIHNRKLTDRLTRTLVTHSYIEGDVDLVSGRGAVVFDNTVFRVVSSRTDREGYVFAPATRPNMFYGFLATNSRFIADGQDVAQLGRAWDVGTPVNGYAPGQSANGQAVIRDSIIGKGFNAARPWGDALGSQRPFRGNIGNGVDEQGNPLRDLNDPRFNRLWEFNNKGQDGE